jgi:endonuclease YncB( thermonuclease family)
MACNGTATPALPQIFHLGKALQLHLRVVMSSLAAALLLCHPSPVLARDDVQGVPRVLDGDTLEVDSKRVRLYALDAPEIKQSCTTASGAEYRCGLMAKAALEKKLSGGKIVNCSPKKSLDKYGRLVAVCSIVGTGEDINAWLVREGYAVAYERYGKQYKPLEIEAQAAQRGLWAGNFEEPQRWRQEHLRNGSSSVSNDRSASVPIRSKNAQVDDVVNNPANRPLGAVPPMDGCVIKGNISTKGEKVYHVPGGAFYERTKIDRPGERYFCSEEEARSAGWRPPK